MKERKMKKFQNHCKYAIPDANDDMTIFYHCISPAAISTIEQTEFVACLCLGVGNCTENLAEVDNG